MTQDPDDLDDRLHGTLHGHARRSAVQWPSHRAKARRQRAQRRDRGREPSTRGRRA